MKWQGCGQFFRFLLFERDGLQRALLFFFEDLIVVKVVLLLEIKINIENK